MSTKKGPNETSGELLFEQLHEVFSLFRSRLHERLRDEPSGVAGMETRVLRFFARYPGASQSDLVQHSRRDKGQIARLVKSLIERELLQRSPGVGNRGGLLLTPAGQALQERLHRHHTELTGTIGAALDAQEHAQMTALLKRLQAVLGSDGVPVVAGMNSKK